MTTTKLKLPNGTEVTVKGSPEEVRAVVDVLGSASNSGMASKRPIRFDHTHIPSSPSGLVSELINSGYFKTPRDLAEIRVALADAGRKYPVTTLSPVMVRATRRKELRRFKEGGKYKYTTS